MLGLFSNTVLVKVSNLVNMSFFISLELLRNVLELLLRAVCASIAFDNSCCCCFSSVVVVVVDDDDILAADH
jgi:hypothetical protein